MMEPRLQVGGRVRVINPASKHYGRTGKVTALARYAGTFGGPFQGPPESRGWRVAFDWPLGGVAGTAVLGEMELGLVGDAPGAVQDRS
ncbi:MAG: hypothetical protein HY535_04840 [Chloroflexi bacterium]|nr:hypothetical protein [Chloroflexota bacterium]